MDRLIFSEEDPARPGWAGALLFNERTGRLIDGHLRRDKAIERQAGPVPVLVGSWTEAQERRILLTLDPVGALAEENREALGRLLQEFEEDGDLLGLQLVDPGPAPDPADWARAFGPSGKDRGPFRQISFVVHEAQESEILEALEKAKGLGEFEGPNPNLNGNALARIAGFFLLNADASR